MTGQHPAPSLDVESTTASLDAQLRAAGDPTRAENEKRYLKSELDFYGASVPAIRRIAKVWSKEHADATAPELSALVAALWAAPVFERRMLGQALLELHVDRMQPGDIALIERLIRDSGTWALVDGLAASIAGPVLERHPDADAILDRWAADDDFWVRRSALLAHLGALRAGDGDFERFARYADAMLEEKEFFIRKAIGWALRDYARTDPQAVADFALEHKDRLSGLSYREATKHIGGLLQR